MSLNANTYASQHRHICLLASTHMPLGTEMCLLASSHMPLSTDTYVCLLARHSVFLNWLQKWAQSLGQRLWGTDKTLYLDQNIARKIILASTLVSLLQNLANFEENIFFGSNFVLYEEGVGADLFFREGVSAQTVRILFLRVSVHTLFSRTVRLSTQHSESEPHSELAPSFFTTEFCQCMKAKPTVRVWIE